MKHSHWGQVIQLCQQHQGSQSHPSEDKVKEEREVHLINVKAGLNQLIQIMSIQIQNSVT